jgi:hypothetical protein
LGRRVRLASWFNGAHVFVLRRSLAPLRALPIPARPGQCPEKGFPGKWILKYFGNTKTTSKTIEK